MSIRTLDSNLNIISALSDEPNAEDGLSAAGLKAKFDESGNTVKGFINDSLIPDVNAAIKSSIDETLMKNGNMPGGGNTGQLLVKKSGTDYDAEFRNVGDVVTAPGVAVALAAAMRLGFTSGTNVEAVIGALTDRTVLHGTSTATAAGAAKIVTLAAFGAIRNNAVISVVFSNTNTAASPSLNVASSGLRPVRYGGAPLPYPGMIQANVPHLFVYDGEAWQLVNPAPEKVNIVTGTFTIPSGGQSYTSAPVTLGFRPKLVVTHGPVVNFTSPNRLVYGLCVFIVPPSAATVPASYLDYEQGRAEIAVTAAGFTYTTHTPLTASWTDGSGIFNYFAI